MVMPAHQNRFYLSPIDESEKEMTSPFLGDRSAGPRWYEIRLQGHLHPRWAAWFDGLALTDEADGTTALRGQVIDQAALHGLLHRVRDTGLPLISVMQLDRGQRPTTTGAPVDP
jgi:hypothetical protein